MGEPIAWSMHDRGACTDGLSSAHRVGEPKNGAPYTTFAPRRHHQAHARCLGAFPMSAKRDEAAKRERPILFSGAMVRAILDGRKTQTRRVLAPQPPDVSRINVGVFNPTIVVRGEEEPGPDTFGAWDDYGEWGVRCPYGRPGDRLWVRETWMPDPPINGWPGDVEWNGCGRPIDGVPSQYRKPKNCIYAASWDGIDLRWRPSIHMPRWASRISLEITGVRVERLQDISEDDAIAESFAATPAEPWWQGYRELDRVGLIHQQFRGAEPPEWMIEPKRLNDYDPLAKTARDEFRITWQHLNAKRGYGWDVNPWAWVLSFKRVESKAVAA